MATPNGEWPSKLSSMDMNSLMQSAHDFHLDDHHELLFNTIKALNKQNAFAIGQLPDDYTFTHNKYRLIAESEFAESFLLEKIEYFSNPSFNLSNEWAREMLPLFAKKRVQTRFDSVAIMATPEKFHGKLRHKLRVRRITLVILEQVLSELGSWSRKLLDVEHFILFLGAEASRRRYDYELPRSLHTFEVYPIGNIETIRTLVALPPSYRHQITHIGLDATLLAQFNTVRGYFINLKGIILRQPYHPHEYGLSLLQQILFVWKVRAFIIIDEDDAQAIEEVRNKIIANRDVKFVERRTEIGKITFVVGAPSADNDSMNSAPMDVDSSANQE